MLIGFLQALRAARLPVSVGEYLTLLQALRDGVIGPSIDDFYTLARCTLVKDEALFDRFDAAFGAYFQHGTELADALLRSVPDAWLSDALRRSFTPEQMAELQALDWETLMRTLRERLDEQRERHQGGSKWIGTGGTSPFGAHGYNPQGIRIGQAHSAHRRAVKVWDQRAYADYDDSRTLGTRQMQVALRRLRRFARQGAAHELDLDGTVTGTAANGGLLDIRLRPERRNQVKVLLLMDVGGSMDEHVRQVEELFSAARSALKHLVCAYFHNCVYEHVWRHNGRRHSERTSTWDLIRGYPRDWKLVFVGDATMSPYEILQPGGSVEHHNPEPGAEWLQRLTHHFSQHIWINPEPQGLWQYRQSIALIQQLIGQQRMHPLTLAGLDAAMRQLSR